MLLSARAARTVVAEIWRDTRGDDPRAVMVGPMPLTPFERTVIVDAGDRYETGTFSWWPTGVTFSPQVVSKNDGDPRVAAARAQSRDVRDFLVWSRFPYWILEETPEGTRVIVADMRFPAAANAAGARFTARTVVR
jgi:inner membrane protein